MFKPVGSVQITEALVHLRELFRQRVPSNERDVRAHEKREIVTRNLLSNLHRTKEHPTLHTVLEIADIFSLTLDGAHQLFGYDLAGLREFDQRLNGGRTHILESYPFRRDLMIDLPSELAGRQSFGWSSRLKELVPVWQTSIPIRALEQNSWRKPGTFYVHVGTEDSFGSSLPPGATASVEPVDEAERKRPRAGAIYLLQFGNGYRCTRCIVVGDKLIPLVRRRDSRGPHEFAYPGSVRIVGRVRAFALKLPQPEYPLLSFLPASQHAAPLVLPWEHRSMAELFATKHLRFRRSRENSEAMREVLEKTFGSLLSARTERRYRRPTRSQPHIDALLQLTLMNVTRYTDALRAARALPSDLGRFSLQTLLEASRPADLARSFQIPQTPVPTDIWDERRREFGEWPALLSTHFPRLHLQQEKIVRISDDNAIPDLIPPLSPGSLMVLDDVKTPPDPQSDAKKAGWMRPIYALRRGAQIFCGHLDRDGNQFVLRKSLLDNKPQTVFDVTELSHLSLVSGVAVPV